MLRLHDPAIDSAQALGFYRWTLDDQEVIGHNGGEVGISSEVLVRISDRKGVVLLANGELSEQGFTRIERALLDPR